MSALISEGLGPQAMRFALHSAFPARFTDQILSVAVDSRNRVTAAATGTEIEVKVPKAPAAVVPAPKWSPYVIQRMRVMAERGPESQWPRVLPATLGRAFEIAYHFFPSNVPAPLLGTTEEGGVEFAWHRGGWDVEIEVPPAGETRVWASQRDSDRSFVGSLYEQLTPAYALLTNFATE